MAPRASVTRSRTRSWKASTGPSRRRVHVGLEVAVAQVDTRVPEGRERVLECRLAASFGAAAVGQADRGRRVEVGEVGGSHNTSVP